MLPTTLAENQLRQNLLQHPSNLQMGSRLIALSISRFTRTNAASSDLIQPEVRRLCVLRAHQVFVTQLFSVRRAEQFGEQGGADNVSG